LVDMDLRKGTLSQTVGAPRSGLTDILVGDARLDDVIVRDISGIAGFDILPEGTVPPNPTELLFSPRVKEVIDELRRRYDYVLLDCPPVEAVADAKVLNKFADMSVFVVRAGLLDRSNLAVIQEYYETNRFNNMALVLNDTQEIHGVYGRYGYGAAYGNYISKRKKKK
ncbi:MAG: CpsD/CapB family tyrosine-protein kinase, partial [Muribaculaceae bacterium]|nr:CpsD/CapB family tyrosine-protein kinase [Muribaculaceae bacterium]